MITKYETMVREFMKAFDQKQYSNLHEVPDKIFRLRVKLIQEEAKEFKEATSRIDKIDALCDLVYVLVGSGVALGLKLLELPPDENKTELTTINKAVETLSAQIPCARRITGALSEAVRECRSIARTEGMNFDRAFEEVHNNNMAKLWKTKPGGSLYIVKPVGDKFLVKDKDGKVVKPLGFKKPNLGVYV